MFQWKYPLCYSNHIKAEDCTFRRCSRLALYHVTLASVQETLWNCNDIVLKEVRAKGGYFAMNCQNMQIEDFELAGNYSFDGAKNVEIHHAKMISKDAFWNTENVNVYDSSISGEYLGWNAKKLTLINSISESLQGMCYIENLQ